MHACNSGKLYQFEITLVEIERATSFNIEIIDY